MKMPSERTRAWLYRVSVAALPLLVAYGVVNAEDAPLWLAAAGAVLNTALAAANTSTSA
jgi:hypothetical protein